jgi:hypothetical protein
VKRRIGPILVLPAAIAYGLAGFGYGFIRFFGGLTASGGLVDSVGHLRDQSTITAVYNYGGARQQVESAFGYLDHVLTPAGAVVGIAMAIYLTLRLPWPLRVLSLTLPVVAAAAEIAVRATNMRMVAAGHITAEEMKIATAFGWAHVAADVGQIALTLAACLFGLPQRRWLCLAMIGFSIFPAIFVANDFDGGLMGWLWLPAIALACKETVLPPAKASSSEAFA